MGSALVTTVVASGRVTRTVGLVCLLTGGLVLGGSVTWFSTGGVLSGLRVVVALDKGEVISGLTVEVFCLGFGPSITFVPPSQIGSSHPLRQI